ncbi:hypothetical protein F5144DRAFT_282230 [Chaetomium tenue]|uniref:Uncharacterized protein n=1 Tax=Chaetomium tenue TaxID=1854479 RepID=A0ACB7P145_9PEZI|nr:hypothetical protein F5144DRAFT_282230 [Chaetomium globosum]
MVELWGNIPVILVLFSWLACLQPEHTSGCGGCRLRVAQRGRGPEATEGERKGGLGSPATAHAGNIQQACGTKHRRPWEQEKKVGRNSMDGPNRLGLRCWQAQRGDFTSLTGRLAIADEAAAYRPPLLPPSSFNKNEEADQETEDAAGLTNPLAASIPHWSASTTRSHFVRPHACDLHAPSRAKSGLFCATQASHRSVIAGQSVCPTGK